MSSDISYQSYSTKKGGIFETGPQFSPHFKSDLQNTISEVFNESRGDPNLIINLGANEYALFSSTTLWTFISNPSFAYMRPWWLATFSFSLLTSNTVKTYGSLAPGLCPFHNSLNIADISSIQGLFENIFNRNSSVISLINRIDWDIPTNLYRNSSGITHLVNERVISED